MIWLFFLLIAVIGVLEFLDEILTSIDLKKPGIAQEGNKVIEKLEEKDGEKGVFIYKLLSVIGFAIIGWLILQIDPVYFYMLAGIVIILYIIVNIHNFEIFEKD